MKVPVIVRVLCAYVAICAIQMIVGMLLPPMAIPKAQRIVLWMFVSNAVTVAVLSIVALRTEWRGWRLGGAVTLFPLAIAVVNGIEGILFLPNSHIEWSRILLQSGIEAVLYVPVWMLLFGRREAIPPEHYHPLTSQSHGGQVWKFAVSDVAYVVLYFVAGSIIFPYVKEFYATQIIPSPGTIVALQLLLRGPVFVVLCLMLVRMLGLPRLSGALAVGALFTILSGVVPLMIPNPYFPDSVRWTHFCEVTSSNLVFGAIVAWLWGKPKVIAGAGAVRPKFAA